MDDDDDDDDDDDEWNETNDKMINIFIHIRLMNKIL